MAKRGSCWSFHGDLPTACEVDQGCCAVKGTTPSIIMQLYELHVVICRLAKRTAATKTCMDMIGQSAHGRIWGQMECCQATTLRHRKPQITRSPEIKLKSQSNALRGGSKLEGLLTSNVSPNRTVFWCRNIEPKTLESLNWPHRSSSFKDTDAHSLITYIRILAQ